MEVKDPPTRFAFITSLFMASWSTLLASWLSKGRGRGRGANIPPVDPPDTPPTPAGSPDETFGSRTAAILAFVWIVATLVPYLIIGETWGMVWFYLAWPASDWLKDLWEYLGSPAYVLIVSFVNFFITLGLLSLSSNIVSVVRGPRGPEPQDSERPRTAGMGT